MDGQEELENSHGNYDGQNTAVSSMTLIEY